MQNFFKSLAQIFTGSSNPLSGDPDGLYYYVRCNLCGEVIRVRLHRYNDLSVEYGENGEKGDTFRAGKVIVGKRCYNRIEAEFTFDRNRKLIDQKITGGKLAEASDYQGDNTEPDNSESEPKPSAQ